MKKLLTLALLMLVGIMANAQMLDPVKFSTTLKTNNSAEGEIVFTGKSVAAGMYIARAWAVTAQPLPRSMSTSSMACSLWASCSLWPRDKEV